jgi:hypothetical protein
VLGKGGQLREVPLPARTRPLITAWRKHRADIPRPQDPAALFLALCRAKTPAWALNWRFAPARRLCGIR